jgi:membrane protease YdiL (CAAX protease family)
MLTEITSRELYNNQTQSKECSSYFMHVLSILLENNYEKIPPMKQKQLLPARANQLALYYIIVSLGIAVLGNVANQMMGNTNTDIPYIVTVIVLGGFVFWLGVICNRYNPETLGFSGISWGSTLSLFIWLTIVGEGMTAFVLAWFPEPMVEVLLTAFTPESPLSWFLFLVMAALIAPIGEEIVFRGFILNSYAQSTKAHHAIWISALLFGLAHHTPPHVVAAFFSGLVFARFIMAGGSLWASIIAHGLINFSSTVMMRFNHSPLMFPEFETTATGGILGLLIAVIATISFFQYHPITRNIESKQQHPIISATVLIYIIITLMLLTLDMVSTLSEPAVIIPAH